MGRVLNTDQYANAIRKGSGRDRVDLTPEEIDEEVSYWISFFEEAGGPKAAYDRMQAEDEAERSEIAARMRANAERSKAGSIACGAAPTPPNDPDIEALLFEAEAFLQEHDR